MLGVLCCVEGEPLSRPPAGFGNIGRSRDMPSATNVYICTLSKLVKVFNI